MIENTLTECCSSCKYRLDLRKYDYTHGGCEHEDLDGFVCLAFGDEGQAVWMVGLDESFGMCECYKQKP